MSKKSNLDKSPLAEIAAEVKTINELIAQSPAAVPRKAREALARLTALVVPTLTADE